MTQTTQSPSQPLAPLYLVDSFAIIFTNYYAMMRSPLTNARGENVSALLGFVKQVQQILRHAQKHTPKGSLPQGPEPSPLLAMLLDGGAPTFRHQVYAEYKANRDETPQDLSNQIGYVGQLLQTWGLPSYKSPGYEADDLIATLAARASREGRDCYIVTADKDLYQLLDSHIRILKLGSGRIEEHRETYVTQKWNVQPRQIRDYLALVGDSSDNVPGVRGIGPKTAAKLLAEHTNLEGIYANIAQVQPQGVRNKLAECKDNAFLSYQLVALQAQVPQLLQLSWAQLEVPPKAYAGADSTGTDNPEFARFLAELGLPKLAKEFAGESNEGLGDFTNTLPATGREQGRGALTENWAQDSIERQRQALTPPRLKTDLPKVTNTSDAIVATPAAVLQSYECICTEAQLQNWCERIAAQKMVAIDTETTSLNELSGELVGISLATAKHQAAYIPLQLCGDTSPTEQSLLSADLVRRSLAACLTAEVKIIGQNFKFDYKFLANWGLKLSSIYFDTMIAAWLLDSLQPVGMDVLAKRYLGVEPIHFGDLVPKAKKGEPQQTFANVPLAQAVHYAAEDADITWQLYQIFLPLLQQRELENLFFGLEMPLVRILGDMELRGIACERSELQAYAAELSGELHQLEAQVTSLMGQTFNLNSPQQLATVLYEKLGLPAGKKTKTGYSTDNFILEKLLPAHPAIAPLLEYRRLNKLHSTYVKSLPDMILPQTGRIHTHFSLIGTETGRLACKDPNLQNIPVKDESGRRIRRAFRPRPGWLFFSTDYSQIELVVLAHLSADPGLCAAFRAGRDIHEQTASQLFCVPPDRVGGQQRRIAKSINFGVIYGMSAFRLSQDLGLTRRDAQNFIDAYFREFSGVKSFIAQVVAQGSEQGFVATLSGRQREIRQLRSNNKIERSHGERMAVNTVVQGSAADIVKRAMILLDKELANWQSQLLLQVHDELILEVPPQEKTSLQAVVLGIMENAYSLAVPLKVHGEWTSESWGELH